MNRCNRNYALYLLATGVFLLSVGCSSLGPGTGTETTNGYITGKVVDTAGIPVQNAQVKLIPAAYDLMADDAISKTSQTTTDNRGQFFLPSVNSGNYNIEARSLINGNVSLSTGIMVHGDTVIAPAAPLRRPGALRVALPTEGIDQTNGYLYIPGTTIAAFIADNTGFVEMSEVPAANNLTVTYGVLKKTQQIVIRHNVSVEPGKMTVIALPSWVYSRKLVLNTSSTGADVAGTVTNFPLLVRLSSANFNFSEAKSGGEDLRFTKPDGSPLPYEIEQWDALQAQAAVWVKVDTVRGNDDTQSIVMLWGNASAAPASGSTAVFDTATGFQGVWHLAQAGSARELDATGNHFDGVPSDTAPLAVPGPAGNARQFNGLSNYITMPNTASGKLNFPKNGTYSLSVWVWVDTLNNNSRMILTKGWYQYFLHIGGGLNAFEFNEYVDKTGWDRTGMPAIQKEWHYVTGVRSGVSEYFYVDGVCVDSTIEMIFFDTQSWAETDDLSIGRNPAEPWNYFKGKIDEARIMNSVPSADEIRLCYMNQRLDDRLVEFR